jgi:hypothetical protein
VKAAVIVVLSTATPGKTARRDFLFNDPQGDELISRSMRSANSVSAEFRAASPTRFISMSMKGWPRSSRMSEIFNSGCSMLMLPK